MAEKLRGESSAPDLVFDPEHPPAELGRLAPRELFAWGWQTVNQAFAAHRDELAETGLRTPCRGLMLFLWRLAVQAASAHPTHLDTLLRDTGRLGTRGECSQGLRAAILALHYLGRAALASREVEAEPPLAEDLAFFQANVLHSLQRAGAAWAGAEADARQRLAELLTRGERGS